MKYKYNEVLNSYMKRLEKEYDSRFYKDKHIIRELDLNINDILCRLEYEFPDAYLAIEQYLSERPLNKTPRDETGEIVKHGGVLC